MMIMAGKVAAEPPSVTITAILSPWMAIRVAIIVTTLWQEESLPALFAPHDQESFGHQVVQVAQPGTLWSASRSAILRRADAALLADDPQSYTLALRKARLFFERYPIAERDDEILMLAELRVG
jgi:hypothetical protein